MTNFKSMPEEWHFPQLRHINDAQQLAHQLQPHVGEAHVAGSEIDEVYYEPGGGCKISLRVRFKVASERIEEQIYYGRLFPKKWRNPAEIYARAQRQNHTPPKFGPPLIFIPEWELVLWAFPNDPGLPGLPILANPERVLALAQAAPEKFGLSQPPISIRAEMTKYVPHRRCGYLYHFTQPHNHSEAAVYAKAYRDRKGNDVYDCMKQIWEHEASQRGEVIIPQPYSYDTEHNILWQEALTGRPLSKLAEARKDLPAVAREVGCRLAALHNMRLNLPQELTLEYQVNKLGQYIAALAKAYQQYAERCNILHSKLQAGAAQLEASLVAPIHASFKFSHTFLTDRGITFIDFDGANLGDPGHDVGSFVAYLYKMEVEQKLGADVVEQTAANFCEAYNQAANSPISKKRSDWFTASHIIVSHIYKSLKRLDSQQLGQFLQVAEDLVEKL